MLAKASPRSHQVFAVKKVAIVGSGLVLGAIAGSSAVLGVVPRSCGVPSGYAFATDCSSRSCEQDRLTWKDCARRRGEVSTWALNLDELLTLAKREGSGSRPVRETCEKMHLARCEEESVELALESLRTDEGGRSK